MLSYFPARDADEPASKEFVRAEIADVKTAIERSRADLHRSLNRQFAAADWRHRDRHNGDHRGWPLTAVDTTHVRRRPALPREDVTL